MCGIAGGVGRLDPEVLEAVRRAGARQAHRGPDADGFYASAEAGPGVALAHRRLAIIDLSADGRQPMADPETGNVVSFNGEIYNYRGLRKELENQGASFRTATDTEVLLRAYAVWGRDCVKHLRGMFAFALWDAAERRVLLARDRIGIKPLYLTRVLRPGSRRVTLFASEVRALLASGLVEHRLSETALSTYLWNGFVLGPHSIIRGVRQLAAGHTVWVDAEGELGPEEPYWTLPVETQAEDSPARLRDALRDAVELRLMSDVPLGVFLSGGIDSSAVAALAVRSSTSRIRTFNIAFEEAAYDESPYARAVASQLGTEHTEIALRQSDFQDQLEPALAGLDQPTFDGINTYFVSRAVREAGITVALSGAGGDELFGGYTNFRELPRISALTRRLPLPAGLFHTLAAGAARLRSGRSGLPPQTRWGKLADAIATRGDLAALYQVSSALFTTPFLNRLWGGGQPLPGEWGLAPETLAALRSSIRGAATLPAISALELRCFVGERLMRDTDTASMAVALEARVPLLDHEVVEAAAALPSDLRYANLGKKQPLRDAALADLDPALFERKKSGFVLPLEVWSRDALQGEIDSAFADRSRCESAGLNPDAVTQLWSAWRSRAPGLYWSRPWALFALLHWTKTHGVSL